MQKSKIEWTDYTVNPVKGYCPMACPYCYARRMYDRFRWDKTIRYEQDAWYKPVHVDELEAGQKIFVGSTFELFGDWCSDDYLRAIRYEVEMHYDQTFIFLTKQPQNLIKWSPFPKNCHIGVSITKYIDYAKCLDFLLPVDCSIKFASFEPLLEQISVSNTVGVLDWVIIGSETGNRKGKPPLEQVQGWAREIIAAADEAGIPVFTKDNLKLPANEQRREFPGVKP